MHHHHFQDELFKQRAVELHREATISRFVARPQRRDVVRRPRRLGSVARRVWAFRGAPGLIP